MSALRFVLLAGSILAASGALDLQTAVPIVRIASSAAEPDPANNVIAPIPGDRESCMAYLGGDAEATLPESFDAERGIDRFSPGYFKRLARTLTHLKAMVAAYRLDAPAVLILDDQEQPVKHPDFKWDASLDAFVDGLSPGWTHVQLSVLALSDSFGVLVKDWAAKGRPSTLSISAKDRARPNTELWSYGAYLVSKAGLANTLLTYSSRQVSGAEGEGTHSSKTLKFDLSRASCIEADNCLLWEGVRGEGWYVATPPLLAAGMQVSYDEADASEVEVAVSELIKENMYHVKRWWETPDALLEDANAGTLSLPSDAGLDQVMEAVGIKPVTASARPSVTHDSPTTSVTVEEDDERKEDGGDDDGVFDEHAAAAAAEAELKDASDESTSTSAKTKDASEETHDASVASNDASVASNNGASEESTTETKTKTKTKTKSKSVPSKPEPVTVNVASAEEAAAAEAAGITGTKSAFDFGKDLWNQAWASDSGRDGDEDVAAVGDDDSRRHSTRRVVGGSSSAAAAEDPDQDEIANMLAQYDSEPHPGGATASRYINKRARAAATLGAWKLRGAAAAQQPQPQPQPQPQQQPRLQYQQPQPQPQYQQLQYQQQQQPRLQQPQPQPQPQVQYQHPQVQYQVLQPQPQVQYQQPQPQPQLQYQQPQPQLQYQQPQQQPWGGYVRAALGSATSSSSSSSSSSLPLSSGNAAFVSAAVAAVTALAAVVLTVVAVRQRRSVDDEERVTLIPQAV